MAMQLHCSLIAAWKPGCLAMGNIRHRKKFHQEISGLRDDLHSHCLGQDAPLQGYLYDLTSITHLIFWKHTFNNPNRIWVELWTKSRASRWTQSKIPNPGPDSWDTCLPVLEHAHETTDPEWRQLSSCSLQESRKSVTILKQHTDWKYPCLSPLFSCVKAWLINFLWEIHFLACPISST